MRTCLCLSLTVLALGCGRVSPGVVALEDDEKPPTGDYRIVTNSLGMKLAALPPGESLMGSEDADADAREDEKPRHRVRITRPFCLGIHEVTQDEYQRVMGANPAFFSPTGPGKDRLKDHNAGRFPVEQVSWHNAVEFCRKLSELPDEKQAGRVYDLPTEAEWEYACRAGTTTRFHAGDSLSSTQANFNGGEPLGGAEPGPFLLRTAEAGSYPPNAWGLYDMHGNVWEWCSDWYGADYYRHSPADDPGGPPLGSARVIRSGDWRSDGKDCRSAFRQADMPTGRYYVTGFRVAMTETGGGPTTLVADGRPAEPRRPASSSDPATSAPSAGEREGEDWQRRRGPRGDGTCAARSCPRSGRTRGRAGSQKPIGGGYAGVVVAGGRVYVTDHQKKPEEIERVLCLDAASGKQLWIHTYPVAYGKLEYGNGPRATPTVHDGRVYALGGVGHLCCLDAATGAPAWSVNLVKDFKARQPTWAFAASPLLFEELVIVHAGAVPDGCLLALDRRTGKEVWRNLPDEAGYATPILIESHGVPQVVCWTPANVRGLDPRTGKLLWTVPFEVTYGTAIATPIFREGLVLVSNYWEGTKAIRLGPKPTEAVVAWEDKRNMRGLMSQPLYRDGHAYLLDKTSGLTCLELKTGKKLWDDGNRMTPKGRNPQASLVWPGDGDRALVVNSDGDLILARLSPAGYREQSRANIIGPTWRTRRTREAVSMRGMMRSWCARRSWRRIQLGKGGRDMAQVKALFYVPLKDNDGRNLTAEIEELQTELYVRFVGWTFIGYVKGAWRMADGTQALDESGAYVVTLDETRLPELEQVLHDFKARTQQEALYLEIHRHVEVRFVR